MQNLKYNKLKKFEAKVDRKLFSFINSNESILSALDQLELDHPYFLNEDNKVAFNMWISTDYMLEENITIIEKFLENESFKLSATEKKYLKNRKNSHLSVFEIIKYDDENIYLRDLLIKKDYKLWEPELIGAIDEGEILIARVSKILDNYNFIGDINHLPSMVKTDFLSDILLDFNNIRKVYPHLTIKSYLKQYSLNIYRIYSSTIFTIIGMKDDIDAFLFNELTEFSNYIERKDRSIKVKEYTTNLINIFEYYLVNQNLLLSDFDKIDLYDFVNNGIKDGFIDSKSSLNSYIATLVKYIQFLSKKDPKYKDIYSIALEISENRFYFMNKLIHNDIFHINKSLLPYIQANKKVLNIVDDFEYFLLYIGETQPELTKNNKLKRKDLIEINKNLDNQYLPLSSAPNQRNFPLIDFFYHCALSLDIIYLYDDCLDLDPNAISFLKLVDEEKYIILFQYLWSLDYFDSLSELESIKEEIIKLFNSLDTNTEQDLSNFDLNMKKFLKKSSYYLNIFNLISYKNDISNFKITSMGQKIFQAINNTFNDFHNPKIIELKNFRKKE